MSAKTIAYDFSLFENDKEIVTDVKEENKLISISETPQNVMTVQKRKHNVLGIALFAVLAAVTFTVATTLIKSNAMISELNNQIAVAEDELKEQESAYSQYQMQVESIYSLRVIEDYAVNVLGMVKAENNQKDYVSLSDGDKAEIIQSSKDKNIIQKIADAISGLWS